MKNRRWSDNDRHLWPFTLSTGDHKGLGFVLHSGAYHGSPGTCHIRLHLWRITLICELPPVVPDYRIRHTATTWDAATIARLGRDWYDEVFPREYGAYLADGNLHTYYGPQTHDSVTTKRKVFFLPWRNWRHVRHSLYDTQGNHFCTEHDEDGNSWVAMSAVKDVCPKARFEFEDFDGQRIVATTNIEEREWRFGTGLFRWLSLFRRPRVSRNLSLEFSSEVGPEKGSWKGGTVGHSIEMLPGELCEAAFRRYCEKDHRSKYRTFRIRYVGPVTD